MRRIYDLLESLRGAELAAFCVLMLGGQWALVTIAPQPHTDVGLWLSALGMGAMGALLLIKICRVGYQWWRQSRQGRHHPR